MHWRSLMGQPSGQVIARRCMLNIAHHLHKNNIPVTLVSKVGADSKGIELYLDI